MLFGKNICYVGTWVSSKEAVTGFTLDSYYIQEELRAVANLKIFDITNKNKSKINSLMSSDVIWMDYPVTRLVSFLVIFIVFLFRKKLVLRIRDLPVEQRRDLRKKGGSIIFNFQLKIIEKLLVWKADVIVITAPDYINYIKPRISYIIVFPHGVSEDELSCKTKSKKESGKYILAYAGSLDRGGMIEKLSSMFSEIHGWELWIAGNGGESIDKNENVKYFGLLSYLEVQKFYDNANAIVIPYPNKEYYQVCIPLKIGEVLATCKPIIMLKLPSTERYLKYIDLENNVIYIDEWSKKEVEKALEKAKTLEISSKDTIKKLRKINWESRIKKLIEEIDRKSSENSHQSSCELHWI